MTTTRTPLRITFGGGGSDLEHGEGVCISATIDWHITVTVAPNWADRYLLHYSAYENVGHADQIEHRLIARVLKALDVQPGVQIVSTAEIPAGTGLGSSGAFTVGLLKALRPEASRPQLAAWACDLDVGQQDQWSAVYGGVNVLDFAAGTLRPIDTNVDRRLSLHYTGLRHDASRILTGPQKSRSQAETEVGMMLDALVAMDPEKVGRLLTEQWETKLAATPSAEHRLIDGWIQDAISQGAYGAKLVGAGNGGFILVCSEKPVHLGLRRLPVRFTHDGVQCV